MSRYYTKDWEKRDNYERDLEIVKRIARGDGYRVVGESEGLSSSRVSEIYKRYVMERGAIIGDHCMSGRSKVLEDLLGE